MGYVNNTHMSIFVPPAAIGKSAGTWVPTASSNLISEVRGAADASFTLNIPVPLPSNSQIKAGAKLKSIDVYYKILTGACDDFATVELSKMVLPSDRSAIPTGAAVTTTTDSAHDTAAKRKAIDDHYMTVTVSTPVYLDDDDVYALSLIVDAAANTVFTIYGARINYELRI